MSKEISRVERALDEGNLGLADNLCRSRIEGGEDTAALWIDLARIARAMGAHRHAVRYLGRAAALAPGDSELVTSFDRAIADASEVDRRRLDQPQAGDRYLLIREYQGGFWSEIFHVLAFALIAEQTDRIPVVYWGSQCRFTETPKKDAFSTLLAPISKVDASDLDLSSATVYPASWAGRSATDATERRPMWHAESTYAPTMLFRDEQVLVSDTWGWPIEILSWIGSTQQVDSESIIAALRGLFSTYIKPMPDISEESDRIWRALSVSGPVASVHVKGTVTKQTNASADLLEKLCNEHVDHLLATNTDTKILLLTDSAQVMDGFLQRYGDRVLTAEFSERISAIDAGDKNVTSRPRGAKDILIDALLAARCDFYLGDDGSSDSTAIYCLKDWPTEQATLLGSNWYLRRHASVYDKSQQVNEAKRSRRKISVQLPLTRPRPRK